MSLPVTNVVERFFAVKELPRLDVVILNAGQANRVWNKVSDANGPWEMTLMVNTLATVFLGLLLLPKLLSTAKAKGADPTDPPHLTFISSISAMLGFGQRTDFSSIETGC